MPQEHIQIHHNLVNHGTRKVDGGLCGGWRCSASVLQCGDEGVRVQRLPEHTAQKGPSTGTKAENALAGLFKARAVGIFPTVHL